MREKEEGQAGRRYMVGLAAFQTNCCQLRTKETIFIVKNWRQKQKDYESRQLTPTKEKVGKKQNKGSKQGEKEDVKENK